MRTSVYLQSESLASRQARRGARARAHTAQQMQLARGGGRARLRPDRARRRRAIGGRATAAASAEQRGAQRWHAQRLGLAGIHDARVAMACVSVRELRLEMAREPRAKHGRSNGRRRRSSGEIPHVRLRSIRLIAANSAPFSLHLGLHHASDAWGRSVGANGAPPRHFLFRYYCTVLQLSSSRVYDHATAQKFRAHRCILRIFCIQNFKW